MTLKTRTILFFILTLTITVFSVFLFQGYRSTHSRLAGIIGLLDELKASAHLIEREVIKQQADFGVIDQTISRIPAISLQFQNSLQLPYKPDKLITMEIMFVRIKRVVDKTLPGQLVTAALLEQIRNETYRIMDAVDGLQQLANHKINKLQTRAEQMISALYFTLFVFILWVILYMSRNVVQPILELGRQIQEVHEGSRDEIASTTRTDEIGRLQEFARQAIAELARRNQVLQDQIAERILAEGKLQISTTTLRNVLNSCNPICITNLDFEILQANQAYYEFWPKRAEGAERIKCYDSRPGSKCHTDGCPLQQIMSGKDDIMVEAIKTEEDGRQHDFIITAKAYTDESGKLIGIVESFQDITKQKEAERVLVQKRDKLQAALEEITTLRGIVPICMYCKQIRDDKGFWNQVEAYMARYTEVEFSHSICDDCMKSRHPDIYEKTIKKQHDNGEAE